MEGKSLGILSSCPSLSPGPVVVLVAGSLGSEEGEHLVTERWRELVGWLAVGSQMPFPCEQKPCQLLGGGDKGRWGSGLWNIAGGGAGSRTLREEEGLVWRGRGASLEREGGGTVNSKQCFSLASTLTTTCPLPGSGDKRYIWDHLGYIWDTFLKLSERRQCPHWLSADTNTCTGKVDMSTRDHSFSAPSTAP